MLLMLDETIVTETPPLYSCYGPIGEQVRVPITAVYPGVAHSPAWRNQPRMSWGVTRRSASPTAS